MPLAGVIATRPATAPVATPSAEALPWATISIPIQTTVAVAAAMWVTSSAMAAVPLAARALPALKPNQPTHSIPAPITAKGRLWGRMTCLGYPLRLPSSRHVTSPAMPALTCTTVPPAKSSTPQP